MNKGSAVGFNCMLEQEEIEEQITWRHKTYIEITLSNGRLMKIECEFAIDDGIDYQYYIYMRVRYDDEKPTDWTPCMVLPEIVKPESILDDIYGHGKYLW